ncbi:hypothetical protein YG5714_3056 [Sulfolobus islandicus Y.G.57.14]|jgi:hypothetical protein|uniref:Uncharacterized protein n=2 Tax=Saccharolobus islandicus TaxID=43080 RepID=C3NAK2_SACI7|nr:hypothetical protein [Sulfolobus islandicus]ACP44762.1 hypothetical protein YG5714_3056 [Sulfolobus islandicus Y.G.57.14]ACP49489.1 conserved hypothetical protein [Sulfolobus islandicus Y.N.15.51]
MEYAEKNKKEVIDYVDKTKKEILDYVDKRFEAINKRFDDLRELILTLAKEA